MDKTQIELSFARNRETYSQNAVVQKEIAVQLGKLIQKYTNKNIENKVFEIGCGTGFLTEELLRYIKINRFLINDLVLEMKNFVSEIFSENSFQNYQFISGDVNKIKTDEKFDLIASGSTFQWIKEPREFYKNLSKSLQKDALLVFNTFGKNNLKEIRTITGNGLQYYTTEEIRCFLKPYFTIEYAKQETHKLYFENPCKVLKHLQLTGVNGLQKQVWTKSKHLDFIKKYEQLFTVNDKVELTYDVIYFVAKTRLF